MSDQPQPVAPQGAHTILVVDDDAAILMLCRKKLGQEGFHVLEAEGSSEALKICAEHQGSIHLLLTDLVLPPPGFQMATEKNQFPRVHGPELVARALAIKKELRVILMSAHTDEDLASHGSARDNLPFLQKPFSSDKLLEAVRVALAGPPLVFKESDQSQAEGKNKAIDWFG